MVKLFALSAPELSKERIEKDDEAQDASVVMGTPGDGEENVKDKAGSGVREKDAGRGEGGGGPSLGSDQNNGYDGLTLFILIGRYRPRALDE